MASCYRQIGFCHRASLPFFVEGKKAAVPMNSGFCFSSECAKRKDEVKHLRNIKEWVQFPAGI